MKSIVTILLISTSLIITGCYDKTELEQQAYVVAIGIDKGKNENSYRFTYQIANPEVGSAITGGSSNEVPFELVTVEGNDFLSATATANTFVSKYITLDHTKLLVVSEELARSGDFLRVMQTAARTTQIRRQVNIAVSKENARDFIEGIKAKLETRPHKYYQLMLDRATETGIIPTSNVHRFFQITEGDADLFLAMYATSKPNGNNENDGTEDEYEAGEVPKEGGNPTEFIGSAVFKEGKMIDTLTGQETRMAIVLDNTLDIRDLLSTYPDPVKKQYRIAGDFSKKKPTKIEIDYKKDGQTKINVTVPFQIEVFAIPSLVNYAQNKKLKEKLRKSIEENLEKKAEELIKKSQEEYQSDLFYWSLYVRKNFTSIKQYEDADWNKKIYPNADITVNFKMERLEFGKMLNDSNLSEVRD